MFRDLSPHSISIYIAILVSVFNISFQYLFSYTNHVEYNVPLLIISTIVSFFLCYFIVRYFIYSYLGRKLKLIYEIIQKSKFGKSVGNEDKPESEQGNFWKSIDKDVAKWADFNESEIQQLQQMEQYRKNFVGNISHELKTPLFSIQGYVHTLLEGGLEDDKVNVHFLNRAADNVDRLITIVDDLETISSLEASNSKLEIDNFNLKQLIEEVISDFNVQANQDDISLSFDEKKSNLQVRGDREKYRQVLNNLIYNSIKYGKKGGETKLNFFDLEKYILVEVADDGIGIAEEHLSHLFDRFYRVDKSRSRDVGGSGLGLSIVKHIVEAHNQTISVRSSSGNGSTFGFTIEKV